MYADSKDAELKTKNRLNNKSNHPAIGLIQALSEVFEHQRLRVSATTNCAKTELLINIKLLCLLTFLGAIFCMFISAAWFGLLWLMGYALSLTALPGVVSYTLPLGIHLLICVYIWRNLKSTWCLFGMPKTWALIDRQ